jgi:hypothetical protein
MVSELEDLKFDPATYILLRVIILAYKSSYSWTCVAQTSDKDPTI